MIDVISISVPLLLLHFKANARTSNNAERSQLKETEKKSHRN